MSQGQLIQQTSHQYNRNSPSPVPEEVRRLFEQHHLNLQADVSKQNEAFLAQIHSYYAGIIAHLQIRIEELEINAAPCTPQKANEDEAPEPITIEMHLEEESLLDNLHHPITPTLAQSFVYHADETDFTKKKQHINRHCDPSSIHFRKADVFEKELKAIKCEILQLKSHLLDSQSERGSRTCQNCSHQENLLAQVKIKLLEVEESRQQKQHLTNENQQLRKQALAYRRQLQALAQELRFLRSQLTQSLSEIKQSC